MAQQGMPDAIELYEGAIDIMAPIIAGVKAAQYSDSTPCTEWNVQALINHNIKVAEYAHDTVSGANSLEFSHMFALDDTMAPDEAEAAFRAATGKVLAAIKSSGGVDKIVKTRSAEMPAGKFLMLPMSDMIVHKWDLATATGQDTSIDSSLAEACTQAFLPVAEAGRKSGNFGPEVSISLDASSRDKLLAFTGRHP